MANYDIRDPLDYRFGQLSAGVQALDTTLTSPAFASLPSTPSTTRYIPITLADDSLSLFETVWVTGHAAGSQAVTVVRGREGSASRAWGTGTTWRVAPTIRDVIPVYATRANLPGDAHIGSKALIVAESLCLERYAGGWAPSSPLQPVAVLITTVVTALVGGTFTAVAFNSETMDTHSGHDNVVNPSRWTVPPGWDGIYDVSGAAYITSTAGNGTVRSTRIAKNGVGLDYTQNSVGPSTGVSVTTSPANIDLIAGDYVELQAYSNHTSGTAGILAAQTVLSCKWLRPRP